MSPKTTFTATMKDGSDVKVEGYLVAPGLAVHRVLLFDGTSGNDWNVTHTPSGSRICGSFPTRRDAIMAAEQFALFADWSQPDGVAIVAGVVKEVLAIRNRILWNTTQSRDKRKAQDTANLLANPKDLQEGFFA